MTRWSKVLLWNNLTYQSDRLYWQKIKKRRELCQYDSVENENYWNHESHLKRNPSIVSI